MELHLKIAGILLMALSLLHLTFPRYFNWKTELHRLSLINRQIMYVHSFFIALAVLLIGLLCLTSPGELTHTTLGKRISLGLGIFWSCRLFIQFFGYSRETWKGRKFETTIHIILGIFWAYLSVLFLLIYCSEAAHPIV